MEKSHSQQIVTDFLENLDRPDFIKNLSNGLRNELQSKIAYLNGDFGTAIEDAQKAGVDINEWLEKTEGWENSLLLVEEVLSYLPESPIICEIGAGTGRESKRFAAAIGDARFHLVDRSERFVHFLRDYFADDKRISVHLSDGVSLPFFSDQSIDHVFSHATLIYQKLGVIYRLALEIERILKKSGTCAFTFVDIDTQEGWRFLEEQAFLYPDCFTFFTATHIKKIFEKVGLSLVRQTTFHNYAFHIYQKG